jgi:hypothetical protein
MAERACTKTDLAAQELTFIGGGSQWLLVQSQPQAQANRSRATRTLGESEKEQSSVGNLGRGEPSAADVRH